MNNISCRGVALLSKLLMLAMFRCKASTELMFIKVSLWMMASIQSFDCGSNDAWPSVAAIDLNRGRSGDGIGIRARRHMAIYLGPGQLPQLSLVPYGNLVT